MLPNDSLSWQGAHYLAVLPRWLCARACMHDTATPRLVHAAPLQEAALVQHASGSRGTMAGKTLTPYNIKTLP